MPWSTLKTRTKLLDVNICNILMNRCRLEDKFSSTYVISFAQTIFRATHFPFSKFLITHAKGI